MAQATAPSSTLPRFKAPMIAQVHGGSLGYFRMRRIVPRLIDFVGGVFGPNDGRGAGDRQRSAQERRTDEFSGLVESDQKVVVVEHEGHRGGGRGGRAAPEDDHSARVLSGVRAVQKSFAAAFDDEEL